MCRIFVYKMLKLFSYQSVAYASLVKLCIFLPRHVHAIVVVESVVCCLREHLVDHGLLHALDHIVGQ